MSDESRNYFIELTYNCEGRDSTLGDQFGHLAFVVDDLEAVLATVEAEGWWCRRCKLKSSSGYIFVKDPSGCDIEILQSKS